MADISVLGHCVKSKAINFHNLLAEIVKPGMYSREEGLERDLHLG